jgi:hypothetical protein
LSSPGVYGPELVSPVNTDVRIRGRKTPVPAATNHLNTVSIPVVRLNQGMANRVTHHSRQAAVANISIESPAPIGRIEEECSVLFMRNGYHDLRWVVLFCRRWYPDCFSSDGAKNPAEHIDA